MSISAAWSTKDVILKSVYLFTTLVFVKKHWKKRVNIKPPTWYTSYLVRNLSSIRARYQEVLSNIPLSSKKKQKAWWWYRKAGKSKPGNSENVA